MWTSVLAFFLVLAAASLSAQDVTLPNGGETWQTGDTTETVTWTTGTFATNIDIMLSVNGAGGPFNIPLAVNIPKATGSATITVPGLITNTARVRVQDTGGAGYFDDSDGDFSIDGFQVTFPNGGQTLQVGSSQTITWNTQGAGANVDIDLSTDGGSTYPISLAAGVANSGSASVTIPNNPSVLARVRVRDTSAPNAFDASNNNFTIPNPSITITLPNTGGTEHVYTENAAAEHIDETATFTDSRTAPPVAYTSGGTLSVDITANATGGDRLTVTPFGANITVTGAGPFSVNYGGTQIATFAGPAVPLVLTLDGTNITSAHVQDLLRAVAYFYVGEAPPASVDATFDLTVNDGTVSLNDSDVATIAITQLNDNPTLTTFGSPFTTGAEDTPVNFTGASMFAAGDQADIDGTVDGFRVDSILAGSTLFAGVTPINVGDFILNTATVLTWTPPANLNGTVTMFSVRARDNGTPGTALSIGSVAVEVALAPSADPPVLMGISGTRNWIENPSGTGPVQLSIGATVSDPDGPDLNGGSLTVDVTGNNDADDLLTIATAGGISFSAPNVFFDPGGGPLLIGSVSSDGVGLNSLVIDFTTNDATFAAVEALCDSIRYDNASNNPNTGTRTVTFTISDGALPSGSPTVDVTVAATNDAPTLSLTPTGTLTYVENATALLIRPTGTLTDPDSTNFGGGSLTATHVGANTANDILEVLPGGALSLSVALNVSTWEISQGGNVVGTYPDAGAGSGVGTNNLSISLTAFCTPAIAEAIQQQVAYRNTSDDPVITQRDIRFQCNDGGLNGNSNQPSRAVNIQAVNDPAVLGGIGGSVNFTENAATPVLVLTGVVGITDPDDANFLGGFLRVDITSSNTANDRLSVVDNATVNITVTPGAPNLVSFDPGGGPVQIGTYPSSGPGSGIGTDFLQVSLNVNATQTATIALFAAIAYSNTSDNPNDANRTLRYTLNDSDDPSNQPTSTVTVTATNDAPVVSGPAGLVVDEDTAGNVNLSFSDLDASSGTNTVQFSLSATNGILTLITTAGLTPVSGASGTKNMTYTGSPTAVSAAIATVTYLPDSNYNDNLGTDDILFDLNDQANYSTGFADGILSDNLSIPVTVNPRNDAPLPVGTANITLDEDSSANVALSFSDVDLNELALSTARFSLSATSGDLTLASTTGLTLISGADGSPSMVFEGLMADINLAVSTVSYAPFADFNGGDTIVFNVNDLGNTGAPGPQNNTHNVAVTVTAINDEPSFSSAYNLAPYANTGAHTEAGWATSLNQGPPDEVLSQTFVGFTFTTTFSIGNVTFVAGFGPAISTSTGDLTFTMDPAFDGIIEFDVRLVDSGPAAPPPHDNTSQPVKLIIARQQGNPLTTRLVHVDVANASDVYGQVPTGGNGFRVGIDAFAVVQDGIDNVIDTGTSSGTVVVAAGSYGTADITRNMTLNMSGGGVDLAGSASAAALTISSSPLVNVLGGTVDQANNGPTVDISGGTVLLDTCAIDKSANNGEAVNISGGDVTLDTCVVTQSGDGAAVYTNTSAGTILIDSCTLDQVADNHTLFVDAGDITIVDSTLYESSSGDDACVYLQSTSATIDADANGGANPNTFQIRTTGGRFFELVANTADVLATDNVWEEDDGGVTTFDLSAARVVGTAYDGFAIEDRILHAIDDATGRGFVRVEATTVYVTQNSGSIQRGVDEASDGDTLEVSAGLFEELVDVYRELNIRGAQFDIPGADVSRLPVVPANETIVRTDNTGPFVFDVDADFVTLNGLLLDGDFMGLGGADADLGVFNPAGSIDDIEVANCIVQNFISGGIYLDGDYNVTEGSAHDNLVRQLDAGGVGIRSARNEFLDIRANTIETPQDGVGIMFDRHWDWRTTDTFIRDNVITLDTDAIGIEVARSANQDGGFGTNDTFVVLDNTIDALNGAAARYGIYVRQMFATVDVYLQGNVIGGSGSGLLGGTFGRGINIWRADIDDDVYVTIDGGTIDLCSVGIQVDDEDPLFGTGGENVEIYLDGVTVNNSCQTGLLIVSPVSSSADMYVNLDGGSISGSVVGVRIDGTGTAGGSAEVDSFGGATIGTAGDPLALDVDGDDAAAFVYNTTLNGATTVVSINDGYADISASVLNATADGVSVVNNGELAFFTNNDLNGIGATGTGIFADGTSLLPPGPTPLGPSPTGSSLSNNRITGAPGSVGIDNQTGNWVDATDNWWGTPTGPTNPDNIGGTGPIVRPGFGGLPNPPAPAPGGTLMVLFSPWWASGVDSAPGTPGFQGGAAGPSLLNDARHAIPTELQWSIQPPNGIAGIPLSVGPRIRAQDQYGYLGYNWSGANGTAYLSFANNPTGASLQGQPVISALDGMAHFTNVSVSTGGVAFTVFVLGDYGTAPVLTLTNSPASNPFNINNFFPTLDSISPTFVNEGSGSVLVQVNGVPASGTYNTTTVVRINGSARPTFFVDPDTLLFTLTPADTSSPTVWNVDVQNPSPGGGTTTTLPLVINDIPDNVVLSNNTVAENSGANALVGTLSTTDTQPSSDTHTYSLAAGIGATDNASFTIIAGNELRTTVDFNFEAKSSYSVRIRCTDSLGAWVEAAHTVFVLDVNENPVITTNNGLTVNEGATGAVINKPLLETTDVDNTPAQITYTLTAVPTHGTLRRAGSARTTSVGSNTFTQADINSGLVTYDNDGNEFTADSFTFNIDDGGAPLGTTNGAFAITINPVNDAPDFTLLPSTNSDEDAGVQNVVVASAFDPGAGETTQSVLAYEITSTTNPGLFSSAPVISTAGTLTYTAAPDANGSSVLSVRVRDDGGTANGGVDVSATKNITVTINPINDAPSFSVALANQTITVAEDSGAFSLPGWATFSPGPANESGQAVQNYTIGVISNPALFGANPVVTTAGTLQFTPAADVNGSSTFEVSVTDNGGGATPTSNVQVFTINVTAVNDAPSVVLTSNPTVNEDAGPQSIPAFVSMNPGPAFDEGGQTVVSYNIQNLTLLGGLTFASAPAISPAGVLTFESAPNSNGSATFQLTVRDNGGTANGGVDTSGLSGVITITVSPVNDAPSFTVLPGQTTVTVAEDSGAANLPGWATFSPGPANESTQSVTGYNLVSVSNAALFATQPAVSPAGTLTFAPAANANGSSTFEITVTDNGGTTPGVDTSASQFFTVVVTPVNDAPTLSSVSLSLGTTEDVALTIPFATLLADSNAADIDLDPISFRIDSLLAGTLTMNGNPVIPGTTIFSTGSLLWTPPADQNGAINAFNVLAWDGLLDSGTPVTVAVNVAPVNDDPFVVVNNGATVAEGGTVGVTTARLEVSDLEQGPTALQFILDSVPANGTLDLAGTGTLSAGQTFFQSDINSSNLSYTHNGGETSNDSFSFHVVDGAGGALGTAGSPLTFAITVTPINDKPTLTAGNLATAALEDTPFDMSFSDLQTTTGATDVDGTVVGFRATSISTGTLKIDQTGTGLVFVNYTNQVIDGSDILRWQAAPNANGLAIQAFTLEAIDNGTPGSETSASAVQITIDVTSVNDQPTVAAAPIAVAEDSGAYPPTAWASMSAAGGAGTETGQSAQAFTLLNVTNAGLFSAGPTLNPTTGELSFTPTANAFGVSTLTITVQDSGGTSNGGVDTSAPLDVTITVNSVNDAPTLSFVSTLFGGPEDSPITVPFAVLQASANENDIDSSPVNFRIEAITNGSATLNGGSITSPTVFTAADNLIWTPAANAFGTLNAFTVTAWDGALSSGTPIQVQIFVEGVNDQPSFTASSPAASLEDAGAVTEFGWATFIAGPNEQTIQTVQQYVVTVNNATYTGTLAFSSLPTIDTSGNLHYTAAPDTNGTVQFSATVQDTGGTATGGIDTSNSIGPFTITVTAVNDAPDFTTTGNPPAVNEDSGGATVVSWINSVDFGPVDENAVQTVQSYIVNVLSNPGLFSTPPSVSVGGTLTYTPAADANGAATIEVMLVDGGGTANGGVNTSAPQNFTITVNPINDAPSVTGGSNPTVLEDAGPQTIANFVGINPGPANESGQTALAYTIQNLTPAGGLTFATAPAISAVGTLTFETAADSNGSATFQVVVQDDGGTASGGVDTSAASGTFTITVTPVNDAPTMTTFAPLNNGASEDTPHTITYAQLQAAGNEADIDSSPVNFRIESVIAGTLTKSSSPVVPGTTTIASGETLEWTPPADLNGTINAFTIVAWDGALPSTPALTAQVVVAAVNDVPSFTKGSDITVSWDQGAQSIVGWATGISAGPADESGQTLTFNIVSNNNPTLFSTQPAVSSTGTLTFTPAVNAAGVAAISLELQDNGGGTNTSAPQAFNITITPAGEINLFRISGNPLADNSGDTLGSALAVLTPYSFVYTVENLGNGVLTLTSSPDPVLLSNTSNCEAYITHQANSPIAASSTTTFVLWVRPLSAGAFSVDININSTDADEGTYLVTAQGTGVDAPDIALSRGFNDNITDQGHDDIGSIPAGVTSGVTYTIDNLGTGTLTFGAPAVSVVSETNCMVVVTPPSATIAAGGSDSMLLDILPTIPGRFSYIIQIDSDDPDEAAFVFYGSGDATASVAPELELFGRRILSPGDTEDVGRIPSGSNTTFLYEARNVGSALMTVTNPISITNVVNAVVVVTVTPGATVAAGQMTPFAIDVQPLTPGAFQFDFELVTNDADESPLMVTVVGQGSSTVDPEIAIDRDGAAIPDGGTDDIGDLPAGLFTTFVYRIRNEGTGTLNLSSPIRVFGETNCEVHVIAMPQSNVAPQDDDVFLISVMPLSTSALSAILRVDSNDANESQYFINIIGTGPQPDIQVEYPLYTPQTDGAVLQTGNATNAVAKPISVFVRNIGTGPLSITAVTPSLQTNCTGALVSAGSSPVAPHTETEVMLTVTPAASGAFSVKFTIVTNDPDTPNFDITIEGTGVKKSSGGGGGDESKCSTDDSGTGSWLLLLALMSAMVVGLRTFKGRRQG